MTADELEKWLEDPQSRDAGTGVGLRAGGAYTVLSFFGQEDIAHIRKVVSLKNWGHDPVKVKLQLKSGTSSKNDTAHSSSSSISGGGEGGDDASETDDHTAISGTSPNNERGHQDRDRARVHDSGEDAVADADGEVDSQASTDSAGMIRSPTWTLSRTTPKLVGSAHLLLRGVLQQVIPVQSAVAGSATSAGMRLGPGTVIVGLVVGGGALDKDKTRGYV
ncbi:hypothetical protein BGY98DRAFT_932155 [Russula aff. rugulosa BPL654]|nr:hypothetical protein BGY98DRAFT_932155 [Russula aff. rugulosa BPL654]